MDKFNAQCAGQAPQRQTASTGTLELLSATTHRAEVLAGRVSDRLHAVCTSCEPCPTCDSSNKELRKEVPPYFEELNSRIKAINMYLASIEDTINRAEV